MSEGVSRRFAGRDEFRFFLNWLRRPRQIGAVIPSSPALAEALAAAAGTAADGTVVELGPGTGCVTRALLDSGLPPEKLIAVERNPSFCKLLRRRFPHVRIVSGEAGDLASLMRRMDAGPVSAVVSSLPLRNMTEEERRDILSGIAAVLDPEGVMVQYTYGLVPPFSADIGEDLGMIGERTGWVLANLPPAAVWRYRPDFERSVQAGVPGGPAFVAEPAADPAR